MNIYERIRKEFLTIPQVKTWAEVRDVFHRVASEKPGHWLLPQQICEAVSGTTLDVVPALVAVACSHISIVMVDDMLDADPRGEHLKVGAAATANMASALQSAALVSIARCEMDARSRLAAMESINEMFLATTLGQYWDVQSQDADEAMYWKIAKTKSSPFFGLAFHLGALMGGASISLAVAIKDLGNVYGEMIQIHDDLHDTMQVPANPDWTGGRSPLPILFARLVDHPERARFEEIFPQAASSSELLEEAQGILIRCGAVSYCVHHLLKRHEKVRRILSGLSLKRGLVIKKVFDDVAQPVFQLFDEINVPATLISQVDRG
jgi:geranylgeranyl pyrophosphate synthase